MNTPEFPSQLITNTETKSVALTPEIEATLPGINQSFAEADQAFLDNPEQYLQNLEFQCLSLSQPKAQRLLAR